MKGTFAKFAFVAPSSSAVLFSRALYPSVKSDTLADANSTVSTGTPAGRNAALYFVAHHGFRRRRFRRGERHERRRCVKRGRGDERYGLYGGASAACRPAGGERRR